MKKTILLLTALLASGTIASDQKLVIQGSTPLDAKLVPIVSQEYKGAQHHISF